MPINRPEIYHEHYATEDYVDTAVAGAGGGLAASVQTSNYTITDDEDVGVDSSGGTFTITLKASPSAGDVAIIRDVGQNCGTTNVAVARNGSTINGAATDENLDVDNGMYMFVYNGSTWKFTPFSGPGLNEAEVEALITAAVTVVRKTADESVTSSTVLQNDNELLLAISANEIWQVEFNLWFTGASGAGFLKVATTVPTGATIYMSETGLDSAGAVFNDAFVTTTSGGTRAHYTTGTSTPRHTRLKVMCANGANAGNIQLQWAQNASNGTATTVLANSYLVATRLG